MSEIFKSAYTSLNHENAIYIDSKRSNCLKPYNKTYFAINLGYEAFDGMHWEFTEQELIQLRNMIEEHLAFIDQTRADMELFDTSSEWEGYGENDYETKP